MDWFLTTTGLWLVPLWKKRQTLDETQNFALRHIDKKDPEIYNPSARKLFLTPWSLPAAILALGLITSSSNAFAMIIVFGTFLMFISDPSIVSWFGGALCGALCLAIALKPWMWGALDWFAVTQAMRRELVVTSGVFARLLKSQSQSISGTLELVVGQCGTVGGIMTFLIVVYASPIALQTLFGCALLIYLWLVAALPVLFSMVVQFFFDKFSWKLRQKLTQNAINSEQHRIRTFADIFDYTDAILMSGLMPAAAARCKEYRKREVKSKWLLAAGNVFLGFLGGLLGTLGLWCSFVLLEVLPSSIGGGSFTATLIVPGQVAAGLVGFWMVTETFWKITGLDAYLGRVKDILNGTSSTFELQNFSQRDDTNSSVFLEGACWKIFGYEKTQVCAHCGEKFSSKDVTVHMNDRALHKDCLIEWKKSSAGVIGTAVCAYCGGFLQDTSRVSVNDASFHEHCFPLGKSMLQNHKCRICNQTVGGLKKCSDCGQSVCGECGFEFDLRFFCRLCSRKFAFFVGPVTFTFPVGAKVLVTGGRGDGKTSLLNGILGLRETSAGTCIVYGHCAFVPHEPFVIEETSVRDNITFGRPFDDLFYRNVIDACCLGPDFASFEDSDKLILKHNGSNISGGQLKRIALARALYSNADCYFLDDPLVGLDPETRMRVWKGAVRGILCGKTLFYSTSNDENILDNGDFFSFRLLLDKGKISVDHLAFSSTAADKENLQAVFASSVITEDISRKANHKKNVIQSDASLKTYLYTSPKAATILVLISTITVSGLGLLDTYLLNFWLVRAFGLSFWTWAIIYLCFKIICSVLGSTLSLFVSWTQLNMASEFLAFLSVCEKHDWNKTSELLQARNVLIGDITVIESYGVSVLQAFCGIIFSTMFNLIGVAIYFPVALAPIPLSVLLFFAIARPVIACRVLLNRHNQSVMAFMQKLALSYLKGCTTMRIYGVTSFFTEKLQSVLRQQVSLTMVLSLFGRALAYPLETINALLLDVILIVIFVLKVQNAANTTFLILALGKIMVIPETSVALFNSYASCIDFLVTFARVANVTKQDQAIDNNVGKDANSKDFVGANCVADVNDVDAVDENDDAAAKKVDAVIMRQNLIAADVNVRHLCVRFEGSLNDALRDVNFTLPHGKVLAIVGRTGAGKSCLVKSFLCPWMWTSGEILVGGVDLRSLSIRALREKISYVPQKPVCFRSSARFNMDPEGKFSDHEILSCARNIDPEFDFPLELDVEPTSVSSKVRLVFGMVRALLKRTALIVLDECVEALHILNVFRKTDSSLILVTHHHDLLTEVDFICEIEERTVLRFVKVSKVL